MKKIVFIAVCLLAIAGAVGIYLYNKPAKSAESEDVFVSTDASKLYNEFLDEPVESVKKYTNKNLEVSGVVESVSQDSSGTKCFLTTGSSDMGVVSITFLENTPLPQIGQPIVIRGLCAGYLADDLLGGNVQLNQAILVQ